MAVEPETIEERVLAAAAPMEAKRFLLTLDTDIKEDGQKADNTLPGVGEKVSGNMN